MSLVIETETPPLKQHADGSIRVGNSRITMETLLAFYKQGETAEELARDFDTVSLAEIYSVIAYYLRHKDEVEAYLHEREVLAKRIRAEIEDRQPRQPTREELQARRE